MKSWLSKWASIPIQSLTAKKANENSLIALSCGCIGNPVPNIFWQQSSVTSSDWINATEQHTNESAGPYELNSSLIIPALDNNLLYKYRCICDNIYGSIISNSARMFLHCILMQFFMICAREDLYFCTVR